MKTIITSIRGNAFAYAVFAFVAAAVMFFAVLPSFPNLFGGAGGPSLAAQVAGATSAPTCTLSVSPSTINQGENTTLTWTSSGASSVVISEGVGIVSANGSQSVHPSVSTTYQLTALNPYGVATCTATVTVRPVAATCAFDAAPQTITAGQSATISWNAQNVASVSIDQGVGSVPASGSRTVSPTVTTTYHLTAYAANGSVVCTCYVTITVIPATPAPTCTLSANPSTIEEGQGSWLTWTTTNASSVSIDHGIGVAVPNGTTGVSPTQTTTYTLTATGENGIAHCTALVTVVPHATPSCTISANPNPCTLSAGGTCASTITWSTQNMSNPAVYIDSDWQAFATGRSGSQLATGITAAGKTFVVRENDGGFSPRAPIVCSVKVTGYQIPTPAPTCTLDASPSTITQGNSSALSWTTTNATSITLNQGIGAVSANGTRSVSPAASTNYTLTATGAGGIATCSRLVTVTPKGQCALEITKSGPSTATVGGTFEYTINFKNIGSANCTGGGVHVVDALPAAVQYVSEQHSGNVTPGYGGTSVYDTGTHTMHWNAGTLTPGQTGWVKVSAKVKERTTCGDFSFTNKAKISAYELNNFGTWIESNTVTTNVSNACQPLLPTCTLDVAPSTIERGASSLLSWTTTNAGTVTIDQGIGPVSNSGSRTVSPTVTTTYGLTARNDAGVAHCSKTVIVTVPPPAPTCTISVDPASIVRGGSATLSWTSTNATAATLDNGIGNVAVSGTRSVMPTVTTEYRLTVTGAGGTATCKTTLAVNEPPAKPTCSLTADRSTIIAGESATLTWSSTNGTSATLNGEAVTLSGNRVVSPRTTTTYTYVVTGEGGTATCEKTITVEPYVPVPPSCTLTITPARILKGESTTLAWTTGSANTVTIDQGIGAVALQGNKTVSPSVNTTYTLTATRAATELAPAASVTCVASVVVEDEPEPEPLSCDAFSASPSTLNAAGNTTLSWNTTSATAVTIDNGVGSVVVDGSRSVYVSTTTLFTLSATDGEDTVTCQTRVTVIPNVVVPKCDAFTVSPTSVSKGSTATLSWSTTNATNVSINNGVGSVAMDGNTNVTVNADTTYTLTASNGSASDSCQATVSVKSSGGGGSSSPRCTLTASDKSITAGEKVTLSWKNTRTDNVLLKDNRGNVIADSKKDKDIDEDEDSVVVKPTKSTSYTLTAIRGSKDRDCTVDINVSNVTVTSSRTPLVAGISLTSVPYTGFDAGPALTAFFYLLLMLWGLVVAYVLVYRNGKVFTFSLKNALPNIALPKFEKRETITPRIPAHVVAPTIMQAPVRVTPAPYAPVIGYESLYGAAPVADAVHLEEEETEEVSTDEEEVKPEMDLGFFEDRAHASRVLISSEALRFILGESSDRASQTEMLDTVVALAKATFPSENGWVIINKERILSLLK